MATDNDTTTTPAVDLDALLAAPIGTMPCDRLLLILERYEALTSMTWDCLHDSPVTYLLEAFNRDFRAALGSLHDLGLIRDLDEIVLTDFD